MERPEWQRTLLREAGFRRCIILYGNVRDVWFDARGEPNDVQGMLDDLLQERFTLRGRWDSMDGLSFTDPKHLRIFNEIMDQSVSSDEGDAYDLGDLDIASASNGDNARGCVFAPDIYRDPGNAFTAMRTVLTSTTQERPMFILNWSEHLLSTANQQDLDERGQLTNLGKAIADQPGHQLIQSALNEPTGLLIIVTPTLGVLPPRFYNHDARVRLISIPTPDLEQRRLSIERMHRDFLLQQNKESGTNERPLQQLAEMTDGMATVDLRNLAALSRQSTTMLDVASLVNLYRFGERESPWTQLDEQRVAMAGDIIRERVKGQDDAVDRVVTMIVRAFLGLAGVQHSKHMTKPKGTLFFVGPTGVGKTELAKSLAEFIFGDETNCIRFDMSEFSQEHADQRLIGAPPGYVGFEEGGQLTNAVAEKPFSVLLFDEIEKAHPRVLDKFLQILEDGRLTDGRGQTVHFSETVIIFTSNIGASTARAGEARSSTVAHFLDAVQRHFNDELNRPELLNRFGDNIIVFDFIDDPRIRSSIMESKLKGVREHLAERFRLELNIDEAYVQHLVSQGKVGHGGRGLINVLEREIVNPMSLELFQRLHQIGERNLTLQVTMGPDGRAVFALKEP